MIWYILYPFRGTTEPPQLASTHPIHKLLHRQGTATARHWLLSILLSVVIAVLLCYPVLFLDKSPAATGLYNLPHHVWTSATEFEGNPNTRADVEMRQVWVYGDYMKALDRRVLREALRIQNALIADGFEEGMTSQISDTTTEGLKACDASMPLPDGRAPPSPRALSWGFHSPLMYWNCSLDAIESDADILSTINKQSMQRSFLNFTLRPTSVFAGKSFCGKELLAADALVITIFDQTNSGIGKTWGLRSTELAQNASELWSLYPEDGRVVGSQLYEFRFKPMSLNDDFLLAVAYFIMAIYVLVSLRKLRAVKSQFGLVITVFAQMSISILASFTICGILKINLARIPREAYPFVVLVIGLENIFRLINAVLSNPPEMHTVHRIANALGNVGHLSLAAAGQNLFILWVLSRIVSPGVAAFCAFAAVALVFDFVFHLTFFVAVLSVDVRRMELQDSLDRISLTQPIAKNSRQEWQSWVEAIRQGKLLFTTRIAGSTVIISFVLALNWHFFDNDNPAFSFRRMVNYVRATTKPNSSSIVRPPLPPPPINQARTPAEWLRMQDHDTAKELITFIKPSAYSFIARVYDPLLIVLKGADGRYGKNEPESFLTVIRQLAEQHFFPVALAVVFAIAFVTLLMNYLVWNEPSEESEDRDTNEQRLTVSSLPKSHSLDVVWLKACCRGHLVSISLDRLTSIWFHDRNRGYTNTLLRTGSMTPSLWPIVASSIDDGGNWLALCARNGQVAFWSLPERRFLLSPIIELRGQIPIFFSFASMQIHEQIRLSLIVITRDGCLREIIFHSGQLKTHQIPQDEILSATILTGTKSQTSIITASKSGDMHMSTLTPMDEWTSGMLAGLRSRMLPDQKFSKVTSVLGVSGFGVILAVRSYAVDMIDMQSRALIHTFQTRRVKVKPKSSLRILHSQRRVCHCGAPAVHSLSIVYTEKEIGNFIMQTYQLDKTPSSQICLRPSSENNTLACQGLKNATESRHWLESPGAWEATHVQSVIGVRKRYSTPLSSSSSSSAEMNHTPASPGSLGNALKHRKRDGKSSNSLNAARTGNDMEFNSEPDAWDAWTMSASGEIHTVPLPRNNLFVVSPGPIARLGKGGAAVGFGYDIMIITLSGHERFEEGTDEYQNLSVATKWRTRRGTGRKT
ncbi:uncharacterized protein K441DRAFT_694161 [Cenococcum geophilum 1.58]|uniref:uncharacterized protein n=1 Tax=Cenococcum geophilum 1.58 TaxID=794803 RepID=UPI00358ED065|nr:hypothetical protein K441DRAFT_694161 [Cenococcum geophilum 1.58]